MHKKCVQQQVPQLPFLCSDRDMTGKYVACYPDSALEHAINQSFSELRKPDSNNTSVTMSLDL